MKIAVLTTHTPHHVYFVRELQNIFGSVTVFCETQSVGPEFATHHSFEIMRDQFELQHWFQGHRPNFSDYARVYSFFSMNETDAIVALETEAPDLVLVFGTGFLKQQVIKACPKNLFNLHGGDPENYRGLDSHLWSIYHKDFSKLVTTLHRLDSGLDTGNIVMQGHVPLFQGMKLHQLRAANTQLCVDLSISAIDMCARHGDVISHVQKQKGRYYSFMPSQLKSICVKNFEIYTKYDRRYDT